MGLGQTDVQLEMMRVYSQQLLSEHQLVGLQQAELTAYLDDMTRHLVVNLTGLLLSEPVAHKDFVETRDVTWQSWDSWWQHTKAIHFPTISKWCKRPPVKNSHTVTINLRGSVTLKGVYPMTNVKVRDLGPVKFAVMSDSYTEVEGEEQ